VIDVHSVSAFLAPGHAAWAERAEAFVREDLEPRPAPPDDAAARVEARSLLSLLGGAGLLAPIEDKDLRACCLTREAVAFSSPLADAVWALQGLGVTPLLLAGDEGLRDAWAPRAIKGEVMSAFAMTEPEAGSDVASMRTSAVRDGPDYVLDGAKCLISNAGIADYYIVFARTDAEAGSRGVTAFLVPADAPGLRFVGPQVMSAPHPLGELALEACRVPAANRVGGEGRGFMIGMATLDQLRPTVGAAACGMARRALSEAVGHAVARKQFGKALAQFQIIQDKLGRMAMDLMAARLLVYRAAHEKDLGAERITTEAAMAKAFATEAAQRTVDEAVQILGGRGVLANSVVDRLYRSVRALRIYEGTTEIQHLIIAADLIARARAEGEARA